MEYQTRIEATYTFKINDSVDNEVDWMGDEVEIKLNAHWPANFSKLLQYYRADISPEFVAFMDSKYRKLMEVADTHVEYPYWDAYHFSGKQIIVGFSNRGAPDFVLECKDNPNASI